MRNHHRYSLGQWFASNPTGILLKINHLIGFGPFRGWPCGDAEIVPPAHSRSKSYRYSIHHQPIRRNSAPWRELTLLENVALPKENIAPELLPWYTALYITTPPTVRMRIHRLQRTQQARQWRSPPTKTTVFVGAHLPQPPLQ